MLSTSSKQRPEADREGRDDHPCLRPFDDGNAGCDSMEGLFGYALKPRGVTHMRPAVAKKLGIDLSSRREGELFKWFLACLLFGKPIQQEIAEQAYARLVSAGLRNPDAVLDAGWNKLVRLLDEAHYVRYDFSTATKLLEVCQELKQRYGNMTELIAQAKRCSELSARLQEFKHIGPVTTRIFMREVGPIWYGSAKSSLRV